MILRFIAILVILGAVGAGAAQLRDRSGDTGTLEDAVQKEVQNGEQVSSGGTVTQPRQNSDVLPGGSAYPYAGIAQNRYGSGNGEYWIFEPAEPKPAKPLPVIVFNHGWGAMSPSSYGGWIEHIVKRGNIVIYPRYQESLRTPTAMLTENALGAVKAALAELSSGRHTEADRARFAIVGHSVGGLISANMAALAGQSGLPRPKAVMSVQPGKTWSRIERAGVALVDLKTIPVDTLLLAVAGSDDGIVKDIDAKRVFNESTSVPFENKDYILFVSDDHGSPSLGAGHFAPTGKGSVISGIESSSDSAQGSGLLGRLLRRRSESADDGDTAGDQVDVASAQGGIDAHDYNGYWKLFDGLTDAAFYGKNREYALGNTPLQRSLGEWSDGTAIKELMVTDRP